MKVALSVSVVQRGKSGVATYIFGLLDGLRRLGWPIRPSLVGLAEDRTIFEPWLDACEWVPVPEHFRHAVANIAWHQTFLKSWLARSRTDIIHIPSYRRIVHRPPCRQVVTIHDCAPFRFPGKYDGLRMAYGRRVVVPLARRANAILSVSRTTAADIERFFGIPEQDIAITPNGIDHTRFNPDHARERLAALRLPDGLQAPWWLYVARLEHPAKNHLRLIEAFEKIQSRHGSAAGQLVLAGADWHGADVIRAAVAASPARAQIFLPGFVDSADLPGWYRGARALVFPSLFEGFGIPPLEAMACGTPTLCSNSGALGEVTSGAALPLDPHSCESIARAMEQLLTQSDLQTELAKHGLSHAAAFTWERTARLTLEVYDRVESASRRSAKRRNS